MILRVIKEPVHKNDLKEIARQQFGNLVKAVVDVEQKIMAVGGELHADEETLLTEQENSRRENTWGINLYPDETGDAFLEFDSMINIKPAFGNRSRDVENPEIREKIRVVVAQLVKS
jgi:hypothetical protein